MVEMEIDTNPSPTYTAVGDASVSTSQTSSSSSLSPSSPSPSPSPSPNMELQISTISNGISSSPSSESHQTHKHKTKKHKTKKQKTKRESTKDEPFYMKESEHKFRHIQENIFKGNIRRYMRRRRIKHGPDQCECSRNGEQCGPESQCINRGLFIECDPETCPCGERCRNSRIQRQEYAQLEVFRTPGMERGLGVRTLQDLEPGDLVIEYVGEVIYQEELEQRFRLHFRPGNRNYYVMKLEGNFVVDAANKGNISRFINHACRPNCVVQKWDVLGVPRIGIFAGEHISANTELTYNYKFQVTGLAAQKCLCGCSNCTGWIGVPSQSQAKAYNGTDSIIQYPSHVIRRGRRRLSAHPGKLLLGSKMRTAGRREMWKRRGKAIAQGSSSSSKRSRAKRNRPKPRTTKNKSTARFHNHAGNTHGNNNTTTAANDDKKGIQSDTELIVPFQKSLKRTVRRRPTSS